MSFIKLNQVIKEIIDETFISEYKLINKVFDQGGYEQYGCWYFHLKSEVHDIVLAIPNCFHAVEFSVINDLIKFNSEFWNQPDKMGYLITHEKVVCSDRKLNPYEAYRFITALKKYNIPLKEFEIM